MTQLQTSAFRAIATGLDDAIFVLDEWWRPRWCNDVADSMIDSAALVRDGGEFLGLFDLDTRDRLVLDGATATVAVPWRSEGGLVGEPSRPIGIVVALLAEGTPSGWRSVRLLDVAPSRSLEASRAQARRLDTIGRLAEVLAHEFSELLTAINGSAAIIAGDIAPRHALRGDVETIQHAAERAAVLTRELTRAVATRFSEPQLVDMSRAMSSMERSLRRVAGEHVQLRLHVPSPALAAVLDVSLLEGSMLHLVRNACRAMGSSGTLTVTVSRISCSVPKAAVHALVTPGEYIQIEVADTGFGMDDATVARCFDPLFSTHGGEGLGLSLVFGAITQMRGYVLCDSEAGRGTTITLLLPLAQTTIADRHEVTPLRSILVVDDEESVRRVAARTLRRAGYRVAEAANADEALALVSRDPSVADLLLTDVMMPGLNGIELANCIVAARPDVRILFWSGAMSLSNGTAARVPRGAAFLQKPFSPEALGRRVLALFDE